MNTLFDGLLATAAVGGAAGAAMLAGAVVGLVYAVAFHRLLSRPRLGDASRRLRAALLEVWLFRSQPRRVVRAEGRLLAANLAYLGLVAVPLLAGSLVSAPVLVQSHHRFGVDGAPAGAPRLVTVELAATPAEDAWPPLSLAPVDGAATVSPPLRQPATGRVVWRVLPAVDAPTAFDLQVGTAHLRIPWKAQGARASAVSRLLPAGWRRLLYPRGEALPAAAPVTAVNVDYPLSGAGWLVWFSVGSVGGALAYWAGTARRRT